MIHRIRVIPDGLRDAGRKSVHRELDVIDELFQTIASGQAGANLASPQVVKFLRPQLLAAKEEAHRVDPNWFSVGMLGGFKLSQGRNSDVLCFQSDELAPVDFTLERTANGYYVSHVYERPNAKQCGGPL